MTVYMCGAALDLDDAFKCDLNEQTSDRRSVASPLGGDDLAICGWTANVVVGILL